MLIRLGAQTAVASKAAIALPEPKCLKVGAISTLRFNYLQPSLIGRKAAMPGNPEPLFLFVT